MVYEISEIVPTALEYMDRGLSVHQAARRALVVFGRKTSKVNMSDLKERIRRALYEEEAAQDWYVELRRKEKKEQLAAARHAANVRRDHLIPANDR